jgi:predicted chitinase
MTITQKLSASVGPGQPNRKDDVLLVQELLNTLIGDSFFDGAVKKIPESGIYDKTTEIAIRRVEDKYFYGVADPLHRIQPDDELFLFLVRVAEETDPESPAAQLTTEMYQLASKMVPGGADRLVRNPIDKKKKMRVPGNIRTYLPLILRALKNKGLDDVDMVLMALATIRAETAGFAPINEGVSKYNTSPKGTPGRHDFDLYDNRKKNLGNLGGTDGADFKGRGFVQLTGRANYTTVSKQMGVGKGLVDDPDQANDPQTAAVILAQFLANHETAIRTAIKQGNLAQARKLVNGGSHGKREFQNAFNAGRLFLHLAAIETAKKKVNHAKHKKNVGAR